jgi:hypothetical protein
MIQHCIIYYVVYCIMSLCKYRNIFGLPNTGAHKYKIFGFAVVDSVLTLIASYFIAKYYNCNIFTVFVILFIIGQIFHILLCVNTAFVNNILNIKF